jgi:hypothetical protein
LNAGSVWDYENGFYWFSHPSRLNKVLAQYELYKTIVNLPGHIFELGVFKGASLIRLTTFRSTLEHEFSRKIVGFDAFGKFPTRDLSLARDVEYAEAFAESGGDGLHLSELEFLLLNKRFTNVELVQGNVLDSLPEYLEDHPETRLALLHLDMDVKEPTKFALDLLYDRVVPDGLIVFDDYNAVAGETEAVDEFVHSRNLVIEKLPFYNVPAFVRKPA